MPFLMICLSILDEPSDINMYSHFKCLWLNFTQLDDVLNYSEILNFNAVRHIVKCFSIVYVFVSFKKNFPLFLRREKFLLNYLPEDLSFVLSI